MYYNDNTIIFLDGSWLKAAEATTDLFAQTLHYGNGVFEGIRSYKTEDGVRIFKAKEHYERLLMSAELMHIKVDYTVEQLIQLTEDLLAKNNLEDAYIRPLIYLGANMSLQPVDEVHVMITAWEWGRYLGSDLLNLMTSSYQRPNPKSCHIEAKVVGHYTNSILATTEAKSKGFDEALLLDQFGFVAEGPGANFFYEKAGVIYTPAPGYILNGITRQTVFELAKEMGLELKEAQIKIEDVYGADGAFFTGTAAEIAGIGSLDGKSFTKPWKETLGYELSLAYKRRVSQNEFRDFALV